MKWSMKAGSSPAFRESLPNWPIAEKCFRLEAWGFRSSRKVDICSGLNGMLSPTSSRCKRQAASTERMIHRRDAAAVDVGTLSLFSRLNFPSAEAPGSKMPSIDRSSNSGIESSVSINADPKTLKPQNWRKSVGYQRSRKVAVAVNLAISCKALARYTTINLLLTISNS